MTLPGVDERARRALLSESEATLRAVRMILNDFASDSDEPLSSAVDRAILDKGAVPDVPTLVVLLVTSYSEILGVIDSLTQSRRALEKALAEHRRPDIGAQQLGCAATDLSDMERRLVELSERFVAGLGAAGLDAATVPLPRP